MMNLLSWSPRPCWRHCRMAYVEAPFAVYGPDFNNKQQESGCITTSKPIWGNKCQIFH